MQHSIWTGRACVVLLVLLTVAAGTPVSDRFISGNWAVQGLGKLNATFITHVCIGITGNKASETWYMRSKIREDQQAVPRTNFRMRTINLGLQVLKTDAIEVKYTIESDLIFNHTAVASWEDAEGRDTAGGVQFVATAVKFVDATPARVCCLSAACWWRLTQRVCGGAVQAGDDRRASKVCRAVALLPVPVRWVACAARNTAQLQLYRPH